MTATGRERQTVLIIGCGIAGSLLAMFLGRAGFTPKVYEASNSPRDDEGAFPEMRAFLEMAPMGVNALKGLEITDEDIQAVGGFPDSGIVFYDRSGNRIGELGGSDEEERYGSRSYILRRGRLAGLLRERRYLQGR